MKTRESGMPDEGTWDSYFDPEAILDRLQIRSCDVVEFGCGFGTFTLPAAKRTTGIVYALDIDPGMVALVRSKAAAAKLENIRSILRDFMVEGTGLPDASADYAMVFNILHCEEPVSLLREARRILRPGGLLGIMHWRYDETTPRGPSMEIRPRPEQCLGWALETGFTLLPPGIVDLPPYHYGMVAASRPTHC